MKKFHEQLGRSPRLKSIDYLLLSLFVMINYWPIACCLQALKNDATQINLPVKIFFSDWLRQGVIPLWNPYLNGGFPVYADPGFAFWNPVTWIFGLIGYNAYTFHLENIFFIIIGAIGFYQLGKSFLYKRYTCLLMGILYSASGFVVGSLEFTNYIAAGAFFPWCLAFMVLLVREQKSINAWYLAFAILLFVTSGHPTIPIGALYFLPAFTIGLLVIFWKEGARKNMAGILSRIFLALLLALVFSLPFLYSIIEVMPFFQRAHQLPSPKAVSQMDTEGFPYILTSLLHPFLSFNETVTKSVLYRNSFISFIGILFLMFNLRRGSRLWGDRSLLVFIVLTLFGILFLVPGDFSPRRLLPGFRYVQHFFPLRLFSCSMVILLVGLSFNRIDQLIDKTGKDYKLKQGWKRSLRMVLSIVIAVTGFLIYSMRHRFEGRDWSILFNWPPAILILIFYLSSIVVLAGFLKVFKQQLFAAIVLEVIFLSWLALPVNGISKLRVSQLQEYIESTGARDRVPLLVPVNSQSGLSDNFVRALGNWSYFESKIYQDQFNYPSALYKGGAEDTSQAWLQAGKPFAFPGNPGNQLVLKDFNPVQMGFELNLSAADTLFIWQRYYPGWEAHLGMTSSPGNRSEGIKLPDASQAHLSFALDRPGNYSVRVQFSKPILFVLFLISAGGGLLGWYFLRWFDRKAAIRNPELGKNLL